MQSLLRTGLVVGAVAFHVLSPARAQTANLSRSPAEKLLSGARQVTFEGRRAGEGYFSADGSMMVFQSEREPGNPFYQIYVLDLRTGDSWRVSPGVGRTTCAWFHPDGKRVLFASTHQDPDARAKQKAELERRAAGKSRRYKFVHDEFYDIFEADLDGTKLRNLTGVHGFDAEASYSPDGTLIAFTSNRHAYGGALAEAERARLASTPEYFNDLYIMNADGSNVRRMTDVPGYDGGPFFSPDGKRLCWRRFDESGRRAEVWTMRIDGTDQRQITRLGAMSWAPFYHPSGDYLVFTTSVHGMRNFELYLVDVRGRSEPVRVTYTAGADVLPVFTPDGRRLAWASTHTADGEAQIFFADWNDAAARVALGLASSAADVPTPVAESPRRVPQTVADISAADIQAHAANMAALLPAGETDGTGALHAVTEYIAATFGRLGLEPAGDHATLFQFCEMPLLRGSGDDRDTREVGCNVLARLRADQPAGAKVLVVGAHIGPTGGPVNPRNEVSGVAGLLEIAEYLTHQHRTGKVRLKRDVVFAAFVGEPISAGFVTEGLGTIMRADGRAPAVIAAYLGLDKIGFLDGTAVMSGVGSSPVWRRHIERRNVPIGLGIELQEAPDPQTTGFHFYAGAVPALSVATPAAPPPQRDRMNAGGAERITLLMAMIARSVASLEAVPDFVRVVEREGAQPGRPYLGTVPDFGAGGSGVKLADVAQDGPAARAGVRAGDVIVELNGQPIAHINAYATLLEELEIGKEVSLVVMRGSVRVPLLVKVGSRK